MKTNQIHLKKYKRFFTFGCSFTNYGWPMWSDIIAYQLQGAEHFNFGKAGSGNQLIAIRIAEANTRYTFTEDDMIMVMWSTMCREDRYKGHWWGTGNIFTPCDDMYDKKFITKYCDPKGYLIRDLAHISMAESYLDALPGDWYSMISVPFTFQQDMEDPTIQPILDVYSKLINSYPADMLSVIWGEYFGDGFRKDQHPNPDQWLTYIDAIRFPISHNTRLYAKASAIRLNNSPIKCDRYEYFSELHSSKNKDIFN